MMELTHIFAIFCSFCRISGIQLSNPDPTGSPAFPLVFTGVGVIRGLTSDDGLYSQFLGIPYGVVDEANPFMPATPYPGFIETFNAYDGSVVCPQVNRQGYPEGHLQCLNLNVYVPNARYSQNRMPVMVYIHGGAFVEGSGTNPFGSPKALTQNGVIVVFINYRLGIYGFMCTDSPKAAGNVGLKDQLLALRWVNEHIEPFGGDKNKITLFGQSAGAACVHLHLNSPHEKVFNRAIIQSAPATSPWVVDDTNNNFPIDVAKKLGLTTDDLDDALDFIAKVNVDLAVITGNQLQKKSQYSSDPIVKPCVEKEFEGIERFVLENPNVAKSEKVKTIPLIIGYTSQELIFQHGDKGPEFFSHYSFKSLLDCGLDTTNIGEMLDLVKYFYIGDDVPSKRLENEITSFASDFIVNHPTRRAVKLFLESDAVVYHYLFSYVGRLSTVMTMNTSITGASHGDDIIYLFATDAGALSGDDKTIIDRLASMWTNFAKHGDPTPETSDLLPVKWEPVAKQSTLYLDIDSVLSLKHGLYHDRMAFWDLFYKLNTEKTKWHKEKEGF